MCYAVSVPTLSPDLSNVGPRTDGVCVGTRPPTLQALMKGTYAAPKLTLATVGTKSPVAAFEVPTVCKC